MKILQFSDNCYGFSSVFFCVFFLFIFALKVMFPTCLSGPTVLADSCDSRCLANSIIAKKLISAPHCSVTVKITSVQYETLTFVSSFFFLNSILSVFVSCLENVIDNMKCDC